MNSRLPALLLLSVTLLSACGGGSSSPPVENLPGNPPPGNPPPGDGIGTASLTFKLAGSPTANLAPLTGANGVVEGTFEKPESTAGTVGVAVVYETYTTGRIVDRTLDFLFRNKTNKFKVGDRLPLYNSGRFILGDQPDGASVRYTETYRSGDRQSENWDSISGTLVINSISPTAIKFTLEDAVMSEDIFKENDPDKFTVSGTITYDSTK